MNFHTRSFSNMFHNVKKFYKPILYNMRLSKTRFPYSSVNNNNNNNNNNNKTFSIRSKDSGISEITNQKKDDFPIEPTKYYTPVYSDVENFEGKFWDAYEKELRERKDLQDYYPDRIRYRKVYDHPIKRAFGIIKDDVLEFFGKLKRNPMVSIKRPESGFTSPIDKQKFPSHADVIIIGGGIVGTSIAFHLQERAKDGLKVLVIEKDLSYSKSSTVLSAGGIRQQFSVPENIFLSKYGMDFLQQADTRLAIEGEPSPDLGLTFNGYLTLASEEGFQNLHERYQMQKKLDCFVEMYSKNQLKERFPWINTDGVEAGVFGVQREGWFDPWSLLLAINRKTKELGTEYLNATVTGANIRISGDFVYNEDTPTALRQVRSLDVTLPDGESRTIDCAVCVIAAGSWSKDVGLLFGIGKAPSGVNSIPIPVEPRKRYVYCFKSPGGPGLQCPLVIDTDGTYFRREGLGDLYICGRSPLPEEEPSTESLSVDYDFFENKVWPSIANRCSSFESLKLFGSWAGYYDYNTFDQNGIIGNHPLFSNLYVATGFSGHGIQQGAGAGLAISELILDSELKTIDVQNLGYERIVSFQPLVDSCCY